MGGGGHKNCEEYFGTVVKYKVVGGLVERVETADHRRDGEKEVRNIKKPVDNKKTKTRVLPLKHKRRWQK